jgi:hypothetical protein
MKPVTTVFHEEMNQILYDRNIEAVFTEDKGPKFWLHLNSMHKCQI